MPRPPRENVENGVYHVFARGNDRQVVYRDDADRGLYLRGVGAIVVDYEIGCLAYCLMNTHVHLLLETPHANLSAGMHRLQSGYAQRFNRRHDRVGHLFQSRYGAVRIESDRQLCGTAAYIARNPVEAGLCRRAEEWRWSSFRETMSASRSHAWLDGTRLLSFFGAGEAAKRGYAEMTAWRPLGRAAPILKSA